ncbi:hypothetical protein V6000_000095 [Aspergillus fumigatus]
MSALQPMAMAQGEQPAIHPFFQRQRDLGIPRRTTEDVVPSPSPLESEARLPAQSTARSNISLTRSMPTPQSLDHMALEHDPNSARRKRRKTEDVNQRTRDPSTEGEPHQGDNSLLLDQPLATLNTPSGEIQFAANAGASNATLPPVVSDVASIHLSRSNRMIPLRRREGANVPKQGAKGWSRARRNWWS